MTFCCFIAIYRIPQARGTSGQDAMSVIPEVSPLTTCGDRLNPASILFLMSGFPLTDCGNDIFISLCDPKTHKVWLKTNLHRFSLNLRRLQFKELFLLEIERRCNQVRRKRLDKDIEISYNSIVIPSRVFYVIFELL